MTLLVLPNDLYNGPDAPSNLIQGHSIIAAKTFILGTTEQNHP